MVKGVVDERIVIGNSHSSNAVDEVKEFTVKPVYVEVPPAVSPLLVIAGLMLVAGVVIIAKGLAAK